MALGSTIALASHGRPWPADPLCYEIAWLKPHEQPVLTMGFVPFGLTIPRPLARHDELLASRPVVL